jgi:hypothetical protein
MGDDLIVKFALTILCSLMFLWGQMATMATPITCASQPAHHCGHACKMPCCAASPASVPQPVSAIPVPAPAQQQISLPAPNLIAWLLPEYGDSLSPSAAGSPLALDGTPLRTRLCTLLI